jgi:Holliday junction resolvase-like predicted endonuclease
MVQSALKALPFELLAYNVSYGDGETDAILKFEKSVWFVESTSHFVHAKSLRGDQKSMKDDLQKVVKKNVSQGARAIEYFQSHPDFLLGKEKKLGIMVVMDGVYPSLNTTTAISFHEERFPVYFINWFDFMTLLEQPERSKFEEFLLWRTEQRMPIVCFDEKDPWGYFFDHRKNPKISKDLIAGEKNIGAVSYISPRFTNKNYLSKIAYEDRDDPLTY